MRPHPAWVNTVVFSEFGRHVPEEIVTGKDFFPPIVQMALHMASYGTPAGAAEPRAARRAVHSGTLAVVALALVAAAVALTATQRSVELYEYHVPGSACSPLLHPLMHSYIH